jgi:hypothetical protein
MMIRPTMPFPMHGVNLRLLVTLHVLRRSFKIRTIWVDSICINQKDDKEKEHQVLLMRQIFSKARKVYIWLGKGTEQSDHAIDWLVETNPEWFQAHTVMSKPFPLSLTPREFLKLLRVLLEGVILGKTAFAWALFLTLHATC